MSLNEPQSKPQQDETPVFSLSEQRQVDPPVEATDRVGSKRELEDRIVDVFQAEIRPEIQAPAPGQEPTKQSSAIEEQIEDSKAEIKNLAEQVKVLSEDARARKAEVNIDTSVSESDKTQTEKDTERADSQLIETPATPRNEATRRDTERADRITREDTERANEQLLENKENDDAKTDDSDESETSNDSLPVSLDIRGKIYIPDVTPFEIWDKLSTVAGDTWTGISLQCTVSGLSVTGHEFVDEFNPGKLGNMVTFDSDGNQTQFTLPLAERINGQGNSWLPCTQGGIYHLPVFCVNGNSAIFPNKLT